MTTQTEALRLAQHINDLFVSQWGMNSPTAKDSKIVLDELRRLHEVNQELLAALNAMLTYTADLNPAQGFDDDDHSAVKQACAASNKAERTTT